MFTAVILTLNSAQTLENTLKSLAFLEEVIILDTGSKDSTQTIAGSFKNVKLHSSPFQGFGPLRNKAASFAKNDWILAIDSDEVLSSPLIEELKNAALDKNSVYSFPFVNFLGKKKIKCCGWQNESHIRLYNRRRTSFDRSLVHEKIITPPNGKVKKFKNPIYHYSMRSIDDFLRKIQKYSTLYAEENRGKQKSSTLKACLHGAFAFLKSYFFQKGFLYGREGLIISIYNGSCSFYKYLKLQEKNHAFDSSISQNKT